MQSFHCSMTNSGPRLQSVQHPDLDGVAQYGLSYALQISPTQAALILNLRLCGKKVVDLEAGSDVLVFDQLDQIKVDRVQALDRNELGKHPRDGRPLLFVKYPPMGGFIPLGTRLADGRPHPHAGTGFGLGQTLGFPPDHSVQRPTQQDDLFTCFDLCQFAFDGQTFRITSTRRLMPQDFFPGWSAVNRAISGGIPDGEDILAPFVAGRPGELHHSGICRWRKTDSGWNPIVYLPITPADTAFEPSLVRARDGHLYFSARGWGHEFALKEKIKTLSWDTYNSTRIWRSTDGGQTWALIVNRLNSRNWSPVVLNRTVGGLPFLTANPPPPAQTPEERERVKPAWIRDHLWAWPLDLDRLDLQDPSELLDANVQFGLPPKGLPWYIDHPIGTVLRLADERLHSLLSFRVVASAEVAADAYPTPQTGAWVEEVTVEGDPEPLPVWNFQSP